MEDREGKVIRGGGQDDGEVEGHVGEEGGGGCQAQLDEGGQEGEEV